MMNRLKASQVKQMIWQGESVELDFKKTITSCEKIAKTMASFANHKGGKLFIGVADDGRITGVKSEEEEKYMIEKAATFFINPMLEPQFEEVYIDDKIILVVHIEASEIKPHYALNEDKKWMIYVRVNDKSILASKTVIDTIKSLDSISVLETDKDHLLLDYLALSEKITLTKFEELFKIDKGQASKTIAKNILNGKIRAHILNDDEFYTIN